MEDQRQRVAGVDAAGGGLGGAGAVLRTATTCAAATYRAAAAGDVASVAFVIVSYGALLLMLRFLRAYEVFAGGAVRREGLRRRVWALCTLLTAMFAWKVAGVMTWPVALGVWAAAAVTSAAGFCSHVSSASTLMSTESQIPCLENISGTYTMQ
ncbi:unnamed protein product [Miscanthus lutarioriparius]|uniref:Uncharacterized protein n=1 Tax=Miscanthus lutarioriparius TaxID=422564 RepID=A0A811SAB0_9POAL|nr:unnamed protein product [Miscanthus lutarioriparius]